MSHRLLLLLLMLFGQSALANDLVIEITKGAAGALPIAIVPFGVTPGSEPKEQVAAVIAADLERSGRFKPLPEADMLARPTRDDQVDFRDWRAVNVENLLIGEVQPNGPGGYLVSFRLYDVFRGEQITGFSVPATQQNLRATAHQIADNVYETLTGEPGAFNTRIAYIASSRDAKGVETMRLKIADADGYNPQTIVSSDEPLMSPAWSPDGRKIAYVSFERRQPSVWIQEVYTGKREKLTSFKGINGAPAWSPDGQKMAMTLSKDGNPDIFVMDLRTRSLRALTRHPAIDTEPAWSPDGKHIVFTSDRGGQPQIYKVALAGGDAQRLTFEGSYNSRASYAPDGKSLSMVTRVGSDFRVGLLNLSNQALRVLTDGKLDESPSFAPNGSMLIYATRAGGRGVLAAVSTDGRVTQRLALQSGDVREPAWSPFYQ